MTYFFMAFRVKRPLTRKLSRNRSWPLLFLSALIVCPWNKSNFYVRNKSCKIVACKIWWPPCMSLGISRASVFADQGKPRGYIVQVVSFMNDVAFRRNLRQPSSIIRTILHQLFTNKHFWQWVLDKIITRAYICDQWPWWEEEWYIYLYCVTPFNALRPRDELTEQQFLESRMRSVTGPTHMLITHPCTHLFSFRIGSGWVHSTYLIFFLICMCSRLRI